MSDSTFPLGPGAPPIRQGGAWSKILERVNGRGRPTFHSRPPPRLAASRSGRLILLPGLLLLLLVARLLIQSQFPIPACGFRLLFHMPCPLCGGTRSWAALAGGRLFDALALNPLAAVSWFVLLAWAVASFCRSKSIPTVMVAEHRRTPPMVAMAIAGLVLLNWVYLIIWAND